MLTKVVFLRIINMDMPPLTSPDRPLNPLFWRILLLLACVLVFSFALHAKVAVYEHGAQPQPSTSSKLLLTGLKIELPSASSLFFLFWFAAFLICLISWQREQRYDAVCGTAGRELQRQRYLRRFLRPPPLR
jgi:hypothetical protein